MLSFLASSLSGLVRHSFFDFHVIWTNFAETTSKPSEMAIGTICYQYFAKMTMCRPCRLISGTKTEDKAVHISVTRCAHMSERMPVNTVVKCSFRAHLCHMSASDLSTNMSSHLLAGVVVNMFAHISEFFNFFIMLIPTIVPCAIANSMRYVRYWY